MRVMLKAGMANNGRPIKHHIEPGRRFKRWTVLSYSGPVGHNRGFLCRCDCGTERVVSATSLMAIKNGSGSCGCLGIDIRRELKTTHGASKTPGYAAWQGMIRRCGESSFKKYERYGGRGIIVCARWLDYSNFLTDMGIRPSPAHELDRIDNNGNYEPSNCRWVTKSENRRNMSSNRNFEFSGETHCIAAWAEIKGIPVRRLRHRLMKLKWPIEKALVP